MTTYTFQDGELYALKDKTIIVTGASTGIGKATAILAHKHGANVAFGDVNVAEGEALERALKDRVIFRKCDVSVWMDIAQLFFDTWQTFGVIHAVISNAGINTEKNILLDEIDPKTGILMPPALKTIDVNLTGMIYAVKLADHFFAKWPETPCQIVMTASAASYLDTPPLYLYCAAKSGVLGLMRALRTQLIKKNITINTVCPWLTKTPMLLPEFTAVWDTLPANEAEDVAKALLMPICRPDINGKSFFVEGGRIAEFEEKLAETQPLWMGQRLSDDVNEGQRRLVP